MACRGQPVEGAGRWSAGVSQSRELLSTQKANKYANVSAIVPGEATDKLAYLLAFLE